MFVQGLVLWNDLTKGFIYERFWSARLLMTEFHFPDWSLCGLQDVKIQLLTNFSPRLSVRIA